MAEVPEEGAGADAEAAPPAIKFDHFKAIAFDRPIKSCSASVGIFSAGRVEIRLRTLPTFDV